MEENDMNSVLLSIFANVIFQLLYVIFSFIYNKSKSGFFQASLCLSNAVVAVWFSPIFIALSWLIYFIGLIDLFVASAVTIYTLFITSIVLAYEVFKYRKVGITGVDVNISKGIDYEKALKLTKRNLKVLGTGADKLTKKENEFLEAISSASRQNRAKLLLCHPNNKSLEEMAKSDGKQPNEYADNVRTSLNRIKKIHQETEKLEIRFYTANVQEDMPIFRLMFFNEHYCLCSFNSFGNKDKGTSAPQLHLRCPTNSNGKLLYYRAFESYFDDLWKQSEENKIYHKDDWDSLELGL